MLHHPNQKETMNKTEGGIQNPMLMKKRKCKRERRRDMKYFSTNNPRFPIRNIQKRRRGEIVI